MRRTAPVDAVMVELDEADDDASGRDVADGEAAHPLRRRRRGLWWTGVGVIVVLVATVVVANVLEARRAAERRAALAELSWVLPALDGPLHEVWRIDGGWVVGETAEALLVSEQSGDGSVQAIDPDTGAVLWSTGPDPSGYCWATSPADQQIRSSSDLPAGPGLVVCQSMTDDGAGTTRTELTSYDGSTGEQVASAVVDGSSMLGTTVAESYISGSLLDDGAMLITLLDLRTGTVAWTYRSTPEWAAAILAGGWGITTDDEVVYFDGPQDLALSLSTGEEVAGRDVAAQEFRWRLPDGGEVVIEYDASSTMDQVRSRVVEADGSLRFDFAGWPLNVFGHTDDEVLIVVELGEDYPAGDGAVEMVGLDPATGAELWRRSDDSSGNPLVTLDGTTVMVSGATATAIDATTGVTRWDRPVDTMVYFQGPVTDADVVLLAERSEGALVLTAVDLTTGEERWRMPAPEGLSSVAVTSTGVVLMTSDRGLIAYRP